MISDIAFAMLRTRERPHSSATLLFFNDTPTTEIYTLSLHDALPISNPGVFGGLFGLPVISQPNVGILGLGAIEKDRKSTRLNSSHMSISYAVFCLKKKNKYSGLLRC